MPIPPPGGAGGIACADPGDGIPGCGCIGGIPGDNGMDVGPCCGGGAPCGGAPGGGI
jgi:hypothetical protein